MFRLQDFIDAPNLLRAGEFARFGEPAYQQEAMLVFCLNDEYLRAALANPGVTAIITTERAAALGAGSRVGLAVAADPRAAYWRIFRRLAAQRALKPAFEPGRGTGCRIHATAVVSENARIGDGAVIEAHAIVGENSVLGAGVSIGPGAKIGMDGMQSVRDGERLLAIPHAGGVQLGAGVVVLSDSIVQRAVYPEFTRIGQDSHVSVMVNVGHHCTLGARCRIAGNAVIGGSVRMGDDVFVGLSATIKNGVRVGDHARILMGSVVIDDVPAGAEVSGNFALPHGKRVLEHVRASRGKT